MESDYVNTALEIGLVGDTRRDILKPLEIPERVTIELTNRCNLSCQMCPRHYMEYKQGFMDSSLFMRIIDEMYEIDSHTLVPFFRGESVLHKCFIDLLRYAKDKKLRIQLATNGTLLTKEIIKNLVEIDLDFISFSVDSIRPQDYIKLRRGSNYSKLMKGIELLLKEKASRKSKYPEIQISAVDIGMTESIKQEFVSFWKNKVQRVRIYPQHSQNGNFGNLQSSQRNFSDRPPCFKPFNEMVIYWDGRSVACNHDWDRHDGLGYVQHDGGLLGVWNGDAYRKLREKHLKGIFKVNDVCEKCDHWSQYYNQKHLLGEVFCFS